jgi:hypothetical protein
MAHRNGKPTTALNQKRRKSKLFDLVSKAVAMISGLTRRQKNF